MAVPKQKKSKSRVRMRKAQNVKVARPSWVSCAHCGDPTQPHRVCPSCGHYAGREVVARLDADA